MSGFLSIAGLSIGALLLGVAYTAYGRSEYKLALLWGIFGYVVFGVGLAAGYWYYVIKPARVDAKTAISEPPADLVAPKRPAFHEKSEWYTVQFGLDTARNKIADLEKAPFTPFVFGESGEIVPLRIYAEDGLVFVDVMLFQGRDKPTVIIKHSEYNKDLPVGWDLNSKEGEALEIVNENGIPVFQLIYKSPISVEVQGVFSTGTGFFVADHSGIIGGTNDPIPRALKPIFKYPAWQHRGEYAEAGKRADAKRKEQKPKELTTEELAEPPRMGAGSGARPGGYPIRSTPYDHLKWTDYTEDYFYDAIWRWKYIPQMGNQTPRDIRAWCPECGAPIVPTDYVITQRDGDRVAILLCSHCIPERPFRIPGFVTDHYDDIRRLIAENLRTGQWREVVKRQIDVRDGRI